MADPRFYQRSGPFRLDHLAARAGLRLSPSADPSRLVADVAALEAASPEDLTFCADKRHSDALGGTAAGACILLEEMAAKAPPGMALIFAENPVLGFALVVSLFYPSPPLRPGIDPFADIDPSAKLAAGVEVHRGAIIGAGAEIGRDSVIGPNSLIGPGVTLGSACRIGPSVTITHALIGDRVIIYAGARLGTDGFGYVMSPGGHVKIPQLGRVIIQDDVEIGANATIDRGALGDTVVGQGTKIDNLVQIGHNVKIGRGCVIAALAGLSGSVVLGDFVAMGGQAGVADHVKIGSGARIGAQSGVMREVPPGTVQGGSPAKPMRERMREVATLERLAKGKRQPNE
jgi:UDP-3-O-[3-hydroxymyristoyl] glucosamine N-acyltransferase